MSGTSSTRPGRENREIAISDTENENGKSADGMSQPSNDESAEETQTVRRGTDRGVFEDVPDRIDRGERRDLPQEYIALSDAEYIREKQNAFGQRDLKSCGELLDRRKKYLKEDYLNWKYDSEVGKGPFKYLWAERDAEILSSKISDNDTPSEHTKNMLAAVKQSLREKPVRYELLHGDRGDHGDKIERERDPMDETKVQYKRDTQGQRTIMTRTAEGFDRKKLLKETELSPRHEMAEVGEERTLKWKSMETPITLKEPNSIEEVIRYGRMVEWVDAQRKTADTDDMEHFYYANELMTSIIDAQIQFEEYISERERDSAVQEKYKARNRAHTYDSSEIPVTIPKNLATPEEKKPFYFKNSYDYIPADKIEEVRQLEESRKGENVDIVELGQTEEMKRRLDQLEYITMKLERIRATGRDPGVAQEKLARNKQSKATIKDLEFIKSIVNSDWSLEEIHKLMEKDFERKAEFEVAQIAGEVIRVISSETLTPRKAMTPGEATRDWKIMVLGNGSCNVLELGATADEVKRAKKVKGGNGLEPTIAMILKNRKEGLDPLTGDKLAKPPTKVNTGIKVPTVESWAEISKLCEILDLARAETIANPAFRFINKLSTISRERMNQIHHPRRETDHAAWEYARQFLICKGETNVEEMKRKLKKVTFAKDLDKHPTAVVWDYVSELRSITNTPEKLLRTFAVNFGYLPKELVENVMLNENEYKELMKIIWWRTPPDLVPRRLWNLALEEKKSGFDKIFEAIQTAEASVEAWMEKQEEEGWKGYRPEKMRGGSFEEWSIARQIGSVGSPSVSTRCRAGCRWSPAAPARSCRW